MSFSNYLLTLVVLVKNLFILNLVFSYDSQFIMILIRIFSRKIQSKVRICHNNRFYKKKVIDKSCFQISNTDFAQSVLVTKTSMLGLNSLGASSKMSKVYLFDKFFLNKSFSGRKFRAFVELYTLYNKFE